MQPPLCAGKPPGQQHSSHRNHLTAVSCKVNLPGFIQSRSEHRKQWADISWNECRSQDKSSRRSPAQRLSCPGRYRKAKYCLKHATSRNSGGCGHGVFLALLLPPHAALQCTLAQAQLGGGDLAGQAGRGGCTVSAG